MISVLGIESSCDETAAAVVTDAREICSNIVWSQFKEHVAYGGVVPEIAARAHMEAMEHVVQEALRQADVALDTVDAIAVTAGPGLIGGVIVGVMTAKTLASVSGKPLIAVNHLEGHALTARLCEPDLAFPYLLLLVSGGHCQFLEVRGVGDYTLLGATIDDALGEAFDKTAKMMGLEYPGGPQIERLAQQGDATAFELPRPMFGREGCDFSFSGLKTAIRYALLDAAEKHGGALNEVLRANMAASFQLTVADILRDRLKHAMEMVKGIDTLVVAGGVAANQAIRNALQEVTHAKGWQLHVAPPALCTDNAAMIAWAGIECYKARGADALDIEPRARWPLA